MKVTPIEEAQNVTTLKIDELIGTLVIFEMVIDDKYEKKSKGVTFKVDVEDNKD